MGCKGEKRELLLMALKILKACRTVQLEIQMVLVLFPSWFAEVWPSHGKSFLIGQACQASRHKLREGCKLELEDPVTGPVSSTRILPLTLRNLKARDQLTDVPPSSHVSKPTSDIEADGPADSKAGQSKFETESCNQRCK